ncbi:MAG: hypothetical protein WC246_03760 [Candidatus Paceibacterota bacterium]|jgi:hypothetical protein
MPIKEFPAYISKSKAAELIAQETKSVYSKDDPMRTRKNKIDRLLQARVDNGKIATDKNGLLCFNDIAFEMRKKFPGCFNHWPVEITTTFSASFNPTVSFTCSSFINNVDECNLIMEELRRENIILKNTIKALQMENEQLRPESRAA